MAFGKKNGNSRVWDEWIPGVLDTEQLKALCDVGILQGVTKESLEEPSIDLTLSDIGYELLKGSVKPYEGAYLHGLNKHRLVRKLKLDQNENFLLESRKTYLFELNETIRLPKEHHGDGFRLYGQATAKSSIGRVDVLARLIVDGMDRYEGFDPTVIGSGANVSLYVEITPITFNVIVKPGISVNQLRLFYGAPKESQIFGEEITKSVIVDPQEGDRKRGATLSLNLASVKLKHGKTGAVYRAKPCDKPIPLWKAGEGETRNPAEYWDVMVADENQRLIIEKGKFYIMRSKERIKVPVGIAVYCKAIDETIGEMRIHYAGFAHPSFGSNRSDGQRGTPLVFEVRGHDVNVCLRDEEIMAELLFYRMSQDSKCVSKAYNDQEIDLSKIFTDWT